MLQEEIYGDLWSSLDQLLIQYPELSEMWLDRDTLARVQSKYPSRDEQREHYRKRAFTSMIVEKLFRIYQVNQEQGAPAEGEEVESITIDNPDILKMWYEGGIRDEYSDFPDFIEYAEKNFFAGGSDANPGTSM